MFRFALALPALLSIFVCLDSAEAQRSKKTPELPSQPVAWINSPPLTAEMLKGKAVFLWYFEEGCPTCRGKWPDLLSKAQQYSNRPVVFIGVNSGNSRAAVEEYVRDVQVPWPVIVDPERKFEQASGVDEINLQNIHQVRVIRPDGAMTSGSWTEINATVDKALEGAKWNVDPAGIPNSLKGAWQAVEFGNYSAAAAILKKGNASKIADVKAAAAKLSEYVNGEIEKSISEGKDETESWKAYRLLKATSDRFAGFDLPDDATARMKSLEQEPAVKKEITLYKQLETASKGLASSVKSSRTAALGKIKKLVQENPESAAAEDANKILAELGM